MTTQIATTNINIIPQRVAADHYQTQSFTDPNKNYDQIYDDILKRWRCNCGDAVERHNPNCKHNILLRAYIKKASQQPEQKHYSNSQELISILERIAKLEHAQESTEVEQHLVERDLEEHQYQLDTRAEQERLLRLQLDQQSQQIERLMDIVGTLQSQVCKLNERTISQNETIKQQQKYIEMFCNRIPELNSLVDRQRQSIQDISGIVAREIKLANDRLDDQAQQVDHLHQAVSAQQNPAEQVVKIVIDYPARQSREAAPSQESESMQV